MKFVLAMVLVCCFSVVASAQQCFVTTYPSYAATVIKTGFSDVACVNGTCLAPAGPETVAIPQSTFFFAASNPQTLNFRVREFIQIPQTQALVTTDNYGNEIVLNAGIRQSLNVPRSRGQVLFVK